MYGTVRNLEVKTDIKLTGKAQGSELFPIVLYVGGIAGNCIGTITRCTYSGTLTVTATLTGEGDVMSIGGIAGCFSGVTISYCTFSGTINAGEASTPLGKNVGAIAGNDSGTDNDTESGTVNN